jgi:hypothetical protein
MGPLLHLSAADRMSAMSNPINSTQTLPVKQHLLPIRTRNVVKNSLISWQYSQKPCYENPLNHGFTKTTWIIQMHELNRAHTHFNIIPNVPSCSRQCSSGLPMNTLYTCLSSPIHATCPTNLILSTNLHAHYATVSVLRHFQAFPHHPQSMFCPTVTK